MDGEVSDCFNQLFMALFDAGLAKVSPEPTRNRAPALYVHTYPQPRADQ